MVKGVVVVVGDGVIVIVIPVIVNKPDAALSPEKDLKNIIII